ncbi:complex III assembly factor LYRM7-like [Argonauta hians]
MSRKHVIDVFRRLHRTRRKVFQNDSMALEASKVKINQEFRKNLNQTDNGEIQKLLKIAVDAEVILRTQVVQAEEMTPGVYRAKLTDDTFKDVNYRFKPDAKLPQPRKGKKCSS